MKVTWNKKKCIRNILILVCVIAIIIAGAILWQQNKMQNAVPTMSLIGDESITIKMNENYEEQGATAIRNEKDISSSIVIEGNVDTTKPGEYKVKYIAYNEKNTSFSQIERTIYVKDDVPPTITLKGKKEVTVVLNKEYEDSGCTAQDNYDGDISSKVVITGEVNTKKEGEYTITYTVEDSSKNQAQETRKVIVKKAAVTASTTASKSGLPVLMYHCFYSAKAGDKGPNNNWMEVTDFEEQMKYLSENNFYFPTWQEVEDYIDGKKTLPDKSVVVTMDDGDPSVLKYAKPIIEKYKVRATSFVVTNWQNGLNVVQKKSNYLDVQSHSHDLHRAGANGKGRIVNISYNDIKKDVETSKNIIGNCTVFCYPFGHYNDTAKKALKDAGYRLAFTVQGGRVYKGADKFALPRVRMSKGVSLSSFKSMVQ